MKLSVDHGYFPSKTSWYHRMKISGKDNRTACHILELFGIRFVLWIRSFESGE
jgi:hypothetical protein